MLNSQQTKKIAQKFDCHTPRIFRYLGNFKMNKPKITFGKIQLNIPKKPAPDETNVEKREENEIVPIEPAEIASTSGKRCICFFGVFFLSLDSIENNFANDFRFWNI